ncbi:MAG: transcriptional regulator [Anaerophaga sp.]|nr:transcriptional regulator [Anaerophaga sp.]MDI3521736.1 hypothetical protein [Anaerophaga sp.]
MARILVCEDDRLIAAIIGKVLGDDSHQVKVVRDGSMAIAELRKESFDLVITDMIMPGNSGLDVIRFIRRQLRSGCPVLIMSGLSEKEHVREAKKLGASDFLSKPLQVEKLKRKVSQLVPTSGLNGDNDHGHKRLII